MADYNPILDAETDPEAGLRSSLFKRMVANPIAIAEGAPGAPRVVPRALQAPGVSVGTISGTTPVAFVGLSDIKQITFDAAVSGGSGSTTFTVAFRDSSTGTWGGAQLVIAANNSGSLQVSGTIDIETGSFASVGMSVSSGVGSQNGSSGLLTVPPSCDAIRFVSSSSRVGQIYIIPIGGRD